MGYYDDSIEIIKQAATRAGSISRLSELSGIDRRLLSRWINKTQSPRLSDFAKICDFVGVSPSVARTNECKADDSDYVSVPVVIYPEEIQGSFIPDSNISAWCKVDKAYDSVKGHEDNLIVFQVPDDSMSPSICKGEQVLIDTSDKKIEYSRLYLVKTPSGTNSHIRRVAVEKDDNGKDIVIFSNDNPDEICSRVFDIEKFYAGDVNNAIIGRAIWLRSCIRCK